jgi:hypothetical protein
VRMGGGFWRGPSGGNTLRQEAVGAAIAAANTGV